MAAGTQGRGNCSPHGIQEKNKGEETTPTMYHKVQLPLIVSQAGEQPLEGH